MNFNTPFFLSMLLLMLVSCGTKEPRIEDVITSNDLQQMRSLRDGLKEQQQQLNEELKQLDEAIKKLDTAANLPLVSVLKVEDTLFEHFIEIQGNIDTKQNIVIHAETPGMLLKVLVKEGQEVRKNQRLAIVEDGGLSQQISQLEVQVSLAKTTYERQQNLWNQNIGSEIQFLQAKNNYEAQQKALEALKKQYDRTQIKAPFSGIIDHVITNQGSVVAPGTPIFRLVNLQEMYVEAEVPETYLSALTKNNSLSVFIPMLNKSTESTIRMASNRINPVNRTFRIEAALPNDDLSIKPNLTAKLSINDYTNPKAILVPMNLISENAIGEQYVYKVQQKNDELIAIKTVVKTGLTQQGMIEITEGLFAGDSIISEGARNVENNQAIKIIPE
ncbi:MAG: efflux RND transporter periplasmic adaptor subunit [Flavobacteriaceae bacterium]|nr:efflux RND transporter periplasmic adaptor subunit [Flavobacteriaceae bacterium]